MKHPRNLTRADLADLIKNTATVVADGRITGLLPGQQTQFAEAFANMGVRLGTINGEQVAAMARARDLTEVAQLVRGEALNLLQSLRYVMKSIRSPDNEFDAVGLAAPARPRSVLLPDAPTHLTGISKVSGMIELRFKGNNDPGTVVYMVYARTGPSSDWSLVGAGRAQAFAHFDVTPREYYRYRVQAQASRGLVSFWSNEATVLAL